MNKSLSMLISLVFVTLTFAVEYETLPADTYFQDIKAVKAPLHTNQVIHKGDRLAICGDSITEQKMYSRIMETYLTVCVPELQVQVRQFGWSGEQASGFYNRMANDVIRFKPTLATTCYGMNDHRYREYTEEIGRIYRDNSLAIIKEFKREGVRVIQGSPGVIGKKPTWTNSDQWTVPQMNHGLLELRNIDVALAQQQRVVFADVYVPMLIQGYYTKETYGQDYMVAGKDGVHPGWAGHVVMAYAFLEAMGLDGEIARIEYDAKTNKATASQNHQVVSASNDTINLKSNAYPFCATGALDSDNSVRSGMTLVPFNQRLNRFTLIAKNLEPGEYKVTWGETTHTYPADALAKGINLAADYEVNPFTEAFNRVDHAVARKQEYETRQVKTLFHGPEGRADMDATVALTETTRTPLVQAIKQAFQPVSHTIKIEAVK